MIDSQQIESYTGIGLKVITGLLQSYSSFKKSNVEKFFKMLLEENKDLSQIGKVKGLEKQFYWIIERVASESHDQKIVSWKNLVVKLATRFIYQDYLENYVKILDNLTAFDLTVFTYIYGNNASGSVSKSATCEFFSERDVPEAVVMLSIKKLAANGLLEEKSMGEGKALGSLGKFPMPFFYSKNSLGDQFLEIISET